MEAKLYSQVLRSAVSYAFQLLAQIALTQELPKEIKPQQAWTALYTVIKRQIEMPGTFDKNDW